MFNIEFTIVDGPEEGGRYTFRQREVIVGSDFTCDLILVHSDVMPQHVRIVDEKDEVFLEDLTGREETKLNGDYVSRQALHNGDELQVGPYVFHVTVELDASGYEPETPEETGGPAMRALRGIRRPPVLAVLIVVGIVGIYLAAGVITSQRNDKDLALLGPVPLPAAGIYGCDVEGKNYVDKAEFTFDGKRPKYRIQYYPGFVHRQGDVVILVNDQQVGTVPATINRWSEEAVSVEIPDRVYRMGALNTIRFDHVKNPPSRDRWGVRDVSVLEVPIPKCDIEVAQKYLNLANKKYEEREITEGNLYEAIRHLNQGQEYVIACEDSPVKDLLTETLKLYNEELKTKYDSYMFNTKKFLKLRDMASAKFELERVLRYIPDESDPRHRKAKDLLEKVEKYGP